MTTRNDETVGVVKIGGVDVNNIEKIREKLKIGLKSPALEIQLRSKIENVITKRLIELDKIFDRVIQKIPSFVKDNYDKRYYSDTFIELMNRQLLTNEEIEYFIANTALEIDSCIVNTLSEWFHTSYIMLNFGTNTAEELKKRLPSARDICEAIYKELEEKGLNAKWKSDYLNLYERLVIKYPILTQVSKIGFCVILGFIFKTPTVILGIPLSWLVDFKIYEQYKKFKYELVNNIINTGLNLKT